MSKQIIIVSRGTNVGRISYNSATRQGKPTNYDGVVEPSVQGSTRINALSVVVRTMEQLVEHDLLSETEIVTIHTLGMVVDSINKGTFKHWLKNGGKKLDGSAVNEVEMELWARFTELYKETYLDITFKNVSDLKIPAKPRFAITKEQQDLDKCASAAWEMAVEPSVELKMEEGEELF